MAANTARANAAHQASFGSITEAVAQSKLEREYRAAVTALEQMGRKGQEANKGGKA